MVRFIFLYFTNTRQKNITISYSYWLCRLVQVEEGNWVLLWSVLLMEGLSPPNLGITLFSYVHRWNSSGDNQSSNHSAWPATFYYWILLMPERKQVCYALNPQMSLQSGQYLQTCKLYLYAAIK